MLARLLRCGCLVLGLAAIFLSTAFASEPRIALIIGNSDYGPAIGKLKNPANDAKLMADTLTDLGFSVDLVLDADQKAMKRAVKGFGANLREAGSEATGLFYYAGHGVQVEGQNFLLPVGAEIEAEADVEIESIAADDVMTQMESAGNRVNLVFLDACRNNPLAASSRSATRGLARLDAPRGSFVGYSTAPGDVAADGDGANSPYALALARELKTPGISVDEAHRNVRAKVLAESGNKQTPWDSSSLTGPVVLAAKLAEPAPQPVAQAAPAPAQPAAPDNSAEIVFWESIKDSVDPSEYEAYLQQYPAGSFALLAKAKVAKLKTAPAASQQPTQHAAMTPSAETTEPDDPNHISPLPDGTIVLVPKIAAALQHYLRDPGGGYWDPGYFFVSLDGRSSGYATGHDDSTLTGNTSRAHQIRSNAIKRCEAAAKTECVMLFHQSTEKRSYKVAE